MSSASPTAVRPVSRKADVFSSLGHQSGRDLAISLMKRPRIPDTPVFESLYEELHQRIEGDADGLEHAAPAGRQSIDVLLAGARIERPTAASPIAAATLRYAGAADGMAELVVEDAETILARLGLRDGLSAAEISELRRQFAVKNHPDLFRAEYRDIATRRMMDANAILDRYAAKRQI